MLNLILDTSRSKRVLNLTVFSISFSLSHSSEGNDLHRICEGYDLHWICEGNDLAAAISVGVTTVVLQRGFPPFSGRLVKRAYDALLLDAGGTLLQLVKPVEEIYASIGRKYAYDARGLWWLNFSNHCSFPMEWCTLGKLCDAFLPFHCWGFSCTWI
ncbi:uncharacterized protein LOC114303916 [Camellia sinensis]|uniref:uncharacterized protein LOC114303916 n=1 Tax=Camellia sinensis TaxID=4442 RepID=UPI001035EC91|nr:uncharacterized protein LOC114303916 [Camellia sinensis]